MSKTFYINTSILVVLLLSSAFILYKIFHSLYGKELLTRIDPIYGNVNVNAKSVKYLFLGDSRIAQWQIPNSIINADSMLNFGIDAQTTAQVLYRAKDYFENYKAENAFIQVGINDLKTIGFYPQKQEYIIKTAINNIKNILILCKNNNCEPVFMLIILPGNVEFKRRLFWNNKINKSVIIINNEISNYCKKNRIKIIDCNQIISNTGISIRKEYQLDCLHLNNIGYQKINQLLNNFLIENGLK